MPGTHQSFPQRTTASANGPGRVGLRQVAEAAGVSTATVSRAVNSPELVSPALRRRIKAAIRHLGWVPHGAARALATSRSQTIGAVFPALSHGDFARAIEALQHELEQRGYTLLLACSEYKPEREYAQVRKFVERGVDALVLVGAVHHRELKAFLDRQKIPFVNTFVYDRGTRGTCVGSDNRKALSRLTRYLLELGHRRFGVIAQSSVNNDRAAARLKGVRDALAERGIAMAPRHVLTGGWRVSEGRTLFRQIIAEEPRPTAVICGNAYLTVGALLESEALGIRVPAEMSVVGYDDIEIMTELPVPITTVRVSSDQVGRRAARLLTARLEGREEEISFECDAEIVVRASSGPAPDV